MGERNDRIDVPRGLYWQTRFFEATRPVWRWLGDVETRAVADEIADIRVQSPVYVTSLARAGTTIVTEMLEAHPALTCHHYSDFPNVWTPYWRNHLLQKTRRQAPQPTERAHRDRIMVTHDSPEAVEEVLWMAYFEGLHDPSRSNVLDESTENPDFERYYTDHIRKLLAVRNARRYLAKGNYNISRLAYLHRLYRDARFLVPVRDPQQHIASLAKQHRLFSRGHALDARVGRQLAMSGHFEFGPYRRAVHFGDANAAEAIAATWRDGQEIEGWARYWNATYGFLADQLEARPALADRCLLFTYEDLCGKSGAVIDAILAHCELDPQPYTEARARYAERLSLPDYYESGLPNADSDLVQTLCGDVHARIRKRCLAA